MEESSKIILEKSEEIKNLNNSNEIEEIIKKNKDFDNKNNEKIKKIIEFIFEDLIKNIEKNKNSILYLCNFEYSLLYNTIKNFFYSESEESAEIYLGFNYKKNCNISDIINEITKNYIEIKQKEIDNLRKKKNEILEGEEIKTKACEELSEKLNIILRNLI